MDCACANLCVVFCVSTLSVQSGGPFVGGKSAGGNSQVQKNRRSIQKSRQRIDLRGDCEWTAASGHSGRVRPTIWFRSVVQTASKSGRCRDRLCLEDRTQRTLEICRWQAADWSERSIRSRPNKRTNLSSWCGRRKCLELGKNDGNVGQWKLGAENAPQIGEHLWPDFNAMVRRDVGSRSVR